MNDDVRALVFYQSINNPDFVEITSGHVSMMAHIQLGANKLKVIDANGGVSTYEKIHDMAKFLSTLSLKLSGSEEIRQVLADKTSINSCSNAGNGPSHS
ncbi:hypothetical protein HDE78_003365 [Rhodanobacter sp. K2T2]|nr:hypothetical protein [Rhodanobacter sp. K2T2]